MEMEWRTFRTITITTAAIWLINVLMKRTHLWTAVSEWKQLYNISAVLPSSERPVHWLNQASVKVSEWLLFFGLILSEIYQWSFVMWRREMSSVPGFDHSVMMSSMKLERALNCMLFLIYWKGTVKHNSCFNLYSFLHILYFMFIVFP